MKDSDRIQKDNDESNIELSSDQFIKSALFLRLRESEEEGTRQWPRMPQTRKKRSAVTPSFSNFLWEYEIVSDYINAMNKKRLIIRFAWAGTLSCQRFCWSSHSNQIICPERLEYIKNSLETWDPYSSDFISNLFESFQKTMKAERSSVSMNEAKFDPDSIKIEDSSQKMKKLRIACLTVCILSTVSQTSVCRTSLCQQFL